MSAAITELSAARASRPAPDPLARPAEESAGGWPPPATPVPAGVAAPADARVERRLSLDEHLVRDPERAFFVRVAGDAWAALGVRDGDLLVVDRAGPPTAGSLVVVAAAGRFALRRLGRDASGRPRLGGPPPLAGARIATVTGKNRGAGHLGHHDALQRPTFLHPDIFFHDREER